MNCSNCEAKVESADGLLSVHSELVSVASLCPTCQEGVLTLKIVLSRRTTKEPFKFEGYLPVSTVR